MGLLTDAPRGGGHVANASVCRLPGARWLVPIMMVPAILVVVLLLGRTVEGADQRNAVAMLTTPLATPADRMGAAECTTCHTLEPVFSHPTNIAPSMNVPKGFPMDGGRVTCVTCHDDSTTAHAAARTGKRGGMLLRGGSSGAAFCGQCHSAFGLTRKSQHPLAAGGAHLPGAFKGKKAASATATFAQTSRSCLGCHDGTIASAEFPDGSSVSAVGAMKGHPVDVGYGDSALGKRRGVRDIGLAPRAGLDGRVRLVDGQVACTSCHSPYSQEKNLLVMSNRGSQLCVSCHAH